MRNAALIAGFTITTLLCNALAAQSPPAASTPYSPNLINDKKGGVHTFPLGVLLATGQLIDGASAIVVLDVYGDGPAGKAGLAVGDRIVSINGESPQPYSNSIDTGFEGPQALLADALDAGCAANTPSIALGVDRAGTALDLRVTLPASPAYKSTFPNNCEKRSLYLKGVAHRLVEMQAEDGGWGAGRDSRDYTTSWCILALLAQGEPKHRLSVVQAVRFLQQRIPRQIDPQNPQLGPKNWTAASVAIALAEYHLASGDGAVLGDIALCTNHLAARVANNGRMGHSFDITYKGNGLTIINVHAHIAWALAQRCGIETDRNAWDRSRGEVFAAMMENGAVRYSSAGGSDLDAPARTGGMAAALILANEDLDRAVSMGAWLWRHNERMRNAHTNCSMGLFLGSAGLQLANPQRFEDHLRKWIPYFELCRRPDFSVMYIGSKRNFGGDKYLGFEPIGHATVGLMLAAPGRHLQLHGGTKKAWLGQP